MKSRLTFAAATDAVNTCYTEGVNALVRKLYRRSYRRMCRMNGGGNPRPTRRSKPLM